MPESVNLTIDQNSAVERALRQHDQEVAAAGLAAGTFCAEQDQDTTGVHVLSFGAPGGRWTRGNLKVSIDTTGCSFSGATATLPSADAAIRAAFAQWQAAVPFFSFSFVAVGSGEDIRVRFGGTGLNPAFTGAGGVLASGGYPGTGSQGSLSCDSSESWTADLLLRVCTHEIGHLIGLSHSNVPNGTMYPFQSGSSAIDRDARDGANAIYGWRPQSRLGDRATSDRATLGVTSVTNFTSRIDTLHMVWKGVGNDSGIWQSQFNGSWSPQSKINGVGCSASPSLAQYSVPSSGALTTGLFMAWKGIPGDSGIYWSKNPGNGWEGQRHVANVGTSHAPTLANPNGFMHMAWKGVGDDTGIYWARHDGGEGWTPQQRINGVGTSNAPSMVAFGGLLYLFWKGIPGDSTCWYSTMDPNTGVWAPQRQIQYDSSEASGVTKHAIGSTNGPTATVRGDQIFLTWKGVQGDQAIWFSMFRGGDFSGQATIPNVGTAIGPSTAHANGQTYVAWKGINDDNVIYWTQLG
ncbi:MAG: M57 family metalloprotease [Solirubrobacteraceae bacterium]|nr:M57 family metalloprotease [Patulibacter sp.]